MSSSLLQTIIHYGGHSIVPFIIGYYLFGKKGKIAGLIMVATILVDLDHLRASSIFDPQRCSIGFHPLHSYPAIIIYFLLLLVPKWYVKALGLGLIIHMLFDALDCLWMF